jgi:hypothetical protein
MYLERLIIIELCRKYPATSQPQGLSQCPEDVIGPRAISFLWHSILLSSWWLLNWVLWVVSQCSFLVAVYIVIYYADFIN